MQQCKHYKICGLESDTNLPPGDACILHSEYPEKPKEAFDKALEAHRKDNKKEGNFAHMIFPGWTDFFQTTFNKGQSVEFRSAKFLGPAVFALTRFERRSANFSGVEFSDFASFDSAEFQYGATFSGARFNKQANFRGAQFLFGSCFFERARFNGETTFEACKFTDHVIFQESVFAGRAFFSPTENHKNYTGPMFMEAALVSFRDIIVLPPGEIIFRETDLRRCLLLNTDVRKIQFSNVTWPQIKDSFELSGYLRRYQKKLPSIGAQIPRFLRLCLWKIRQRWPQVGRRVCVYDELFHFKRTGLQSGPRKHPWPQIERLYRQLKQHYEDQRDFRRANDFHYGEKEALRKNPETPVDLRALLTAYWLVSGYGERALRPFIWLVALLFGCAGCYLLVGLKGIRTWDTTEMLSFWNPGDWLQALHYSLQAMTFARGEAVAIPMGYARFVHTIQGIIGPLLVGLFALALRQKLKR